MKTIIPIVVWCLFLVSCAATKTTINDESKIIEDRDSVVMAEESVRVQIDTTRTSDTHIRVTEIEFFEPDSASVEGTPDPAMDSAEIPRPVVPAIKKIKITEIGQESKENGQMSVTADRQDSLTTNSHTHKDMDLHVKEKPIDPFVWRSIAIVATIIFSLAAILWIRKKL